MEKCNNHGLHRNNGYLISKKYCIKDVLRMCREINDGYVLEEQLEYEAWISNCNNECYYKAWCDEINLNNDNKNKVLN